MNVSLIIAAGGSSRRFLKGRRPKEKSSKLFLPLGEKPVLAHTLESFRGISEIREIILAVPRGTERWIRSNVLNGKAGPSIRIVPGGVTRAESVWKALLKTSPRHSWILVHDGARPFPPKKEIQKMLQRPPAADGIVLGKPVVPTLKRVGSKGQILETVDRAHLFEAETPQLVRRSVLLQAYRKNPDAFRATDESSLVEAAGGTMKVRSHAGWNLKVTSPEDLELASARQGSVPVAVGFGRDTHRLVEGRKLYLGGIRIPFEKGTLGHSDGDALLHAVADAVLGALALGDIGEWFSDRNPRHAGTRSEKILRKVLEEARRKGWAPVQVDTVIVLERPRLGNHKKEIRKRLARIMDLSEESVSVKAKTAEGLGPEGEGRAVTCEALVLMRRAS